MTERTALVTRIGNIVERVDVVEGSAQALDVMECVLREDGRPDLVAEARHALLIHAYYDGTLADGSRRVFELAPAYVHA